MITFVLPQPELELRTNVIAIGDVDVIIVVTAVMYHLNFGLCPIIICNHINLTP